MISRFSESLICSSVLKFELVMQKQRSKKVEQLMLEKGRLHFEKMTVWTGAAPLD